MSHLEYQTPFHPGPFASQQQNQHQQQQQQQHHTQAQQQQGHQQQQQQQQQPYTTHSPNPHQFNAPGGVSASSAAAASISASPSVSSTPHQAQAFAPAPSYPGHNLSRPPPPQFHDGLMQHQPNNYSPAGSFPAGQQNPYTSAPFAQSMTATSATPPPQQQQQQQQQAIRHSASPQQLNSPYAGPQHQFQQPGQPQLQQQQQTPKQNTPPTRYPMAAPPLPQTPNVVQQAGAAAAGSPQAPQSPNTQAREQKRVDLLLEINIELLQEINNLQAQGRGGAMNPQHQVQLRQLNLPDSMAAEEYIQCLRRVQANLAYLAPRADTQQAAKAPPGPAHMTPPAHMPQLQPRYDQLRELFPGWVSNDMRMAQNAASPRTHQMNNSMNGMNSQTAQA